MFLDNRPFYWVWIYSGHFYLKESFNDFAEGFSTAHEDVNHQSF